MKEEFLHYVWKTKQFIHKQLKTTSGDTIQILKPGLYNTDAGPDFFNAHIKIGATLWVGNVEMHLKTSDWLKHNHQNDPAYNNVILHVVLEEDQVISLPNSQFLPCLELKTRIAPTLVKRYQKLIRNQAWIPCQAFIPTMDSNIINIWIEKLVFEKLMSKIHSLEQLLETSGNDWESVFYQILSRNFGLKANAAPFELLAQAVPWLTLLKHKNSLFQIEALLFGQAGLLRHSFIDDYPIRLKKEFHFLKEKYNFTPLNKEIWKFSRMRPANFPTIRIAQLATLIYQIDNLFGKVLAAADIKELENLFDIKLSNYWQDHYQFDKSSIKRKKTLGKKTIHLFIINTIVPFLFLYGTRKSEDKYKHKALQLLKELQPEQNHIIKKWQGLGIKTQSAAQTQGLLFLKKNYCESFKCLDCALGHSILSS